MKYTKTLLPLLFLALLIVVGCKKKDNPNPTPTTTTSGTTGTTSTTSSTSGGSYLLVIDNGGESMNPDEKLTFKAHLVNSSGQVSTPTNVTWTSSDGAIASFNADGSVVVKGVGVTTVTATVTVDGTTYTAIAPLKIALPELFAVAPAAFLGVVGEEIDLLPVYLTKDNITYSFSGGSSGVATISASGHLVATGIGTTSVTVTASNGAVVNVPVMIVGVPKVTLPVAKVEVTPRTKELFRGQSFQFSAKAFNSSLAEVTGKTFTWRTSDPAIATVDAGGNVTAKQIGDVKIQAVADGIMGEATLEVQPDTAVLITPYMSMVPAGGTQQFVANVYDVRNGWKQLSGVTNIKWEIPSYGPGFEAFDIATVNSTGLVTMKATASLGLQTFLLASVNGSETAMGATSIAVGEKIDCGTGNSAVKSIRVNNDPISIAFMETGKSVDAEGLDGSGNKVSSPDLHFHSSNSLVLMVDESTGDLTVLSPGKTTVDITICSGSYASKKIKVNVN